MKTYTVVLAKSAEKELYNLPNATILKAVEVLQQLEKNPRPMGCKKLKDYTNLWRVRIATIELFTALKMSFY